jgi:hypothetical protein
MALVYVNIREPLPVQNPPPVAQGDGTHNDGPVIKRALEFIKERGGGELYFPPGVYLTKQQHEINNMPICIRGADSNLSILLWDPPDGNTVGLSFRILEANEWGPPRLRLENLSLVTKRRSSRPALNMVWGDAGASRQKSLQFLVQDIQIRGLGGTDQWDTGIRCERGIGGAFRNIQVMGSAEVSRDPQELDKSIGIRIFGTGREPNKRMINVSISQCLVYAYGTSLQLTDAEGIHVSQFEFVSTLIGVKAARVYEAHFVSGHIDHRRQAFKCHDSGVILISACATEHHKADRITGDVAEFDACTQVTIVGNRFAGDGKVTGGVTSYGITVEPHSSKELINIIGNAFAGLGEYAIKFQSGTSRNRVVGNSYIRLGQVPVINLGDSDNIVYPPGDTS